MNIRQALKRKNVLVKELNEAYGKLYSENVIIVGNERNYDPEKILKDIDSKTEELIKLKTAIHTANAPVFAQIFALSELKNNVTRLRQLDCQEGIVPSRYGNDAPVVKEATITIKRKDEIIAQLEKTIDTIQEGLDQFNSVTQVTL